MTINRSNSMRRNLIFSFLIPGILLGVNLVISALMAILYITTEIPVFYILYFIIFILLGAAYAYVSIKMYKDVYDFYYNDLYLTTRNNYHKLLINDPNLESYKATSINEVVTLNEDLKILSSEISSTYVISKIPKYANLNLEYVDEKYNLVTFKSFEKELKNIITLSQSYRNVLIDVSYDLKDEVLSNIYQSFESALGRSLQPMEIATIREWVDLGYSDEMIINALKEALSQGKKSLRSVDKILLSWAKREDLETEGKTPIDDEWTKNLEETIRIAKTPWLDDDDDDE